MYDINTTVTSLSPGSGNETCSSRMELWSWVVAAAILPVSFLVWKVSAFLVRYHRWCKAMRSLPGWPPHWFWGHLRLIKPDQETMLSVIAWINEHKFRITQGWMGPIYPCISLYHYDLVKKVFKEPKYHRTYDLMVPWLGEGLLTVRDGEKWYRNRHLLTPAFHFEILKQYVGVYNSSVEVLLNKWSTATARKEPVKLFDTISLLSLDIILQCAFSYKSDCQNVQTRHPYIKCVYELIELLADRFFTPLYQFDWIYFLTPAGRRMKKACRVVHEYSERVIRERKKALGLEGGGCGKEGESVLERAARQRKYLDFLDTLLTAVDEDGNGMTDLEIRNEVDTFMFEGHDTTTSGISWTLYCLAKYPEHQQKVREEVNNVLMGREWLEFDDLKELKYTQWCIKEAMRLYPPVFVIFRETSEDMELDNYMIPKGVLIFIPIVGLHRNAEIWENPEKFDPLRFHPDNAEGRDPYAYLPFSAGHRNCIGQNFAMNEERVVVASIVRQFRLSLVEGHEVEMVPKVVLRTKNDIKVNLEPVL